MSAPREEYDAIVVGARCAGSATAMLLARAGLRVLLLDRAHPGRDTLSTHALMRAGVLQLRPLGRPADRIVAAGTPPVTGTTFHYADGAETVAARGEPLYAPRRTVLDTALLDRGARGRRRTPVSGSTSPTWCATAPGGSPGCRPGPRRPAWRRSGRRLTVGADGLRSDGGPGRRRRAPRWRGSARERGRLRLLAGRRPASATSGSTGPACTAGIIPTNGGAGLRLGRAARAALRRGAPRRPVRRCSPACSPRPRPRPSTWSPRGDRTEPPARIPRGCPPSCGAPPVPAGRWSATPDTSRTR